MKYFIYSVFDKEVSVYDTTYCYQNDVYVRRFFENILSKDMNLKQRADKFSVHKVGSFELDKGVIEPIVPQVVFELSSLVGE